MARSSNNEAEKYRARWQTDEGSRRAAQVIHALKHGGKLDRLKFLTKVDGRWDLRGFIMPKAPVEGPFYVKGRVLNELRGSIWFKKCLVKDVDFSYAHLSDTAWEYCRFENVVADYATLRYFKCVASSFDSSTFISADLRDAALGVSNGKQYSRYTNVSFFRADMRDTSHRFELYDTCDFSNANLEKVNFDGARFVNCKFSGLLSEVAFRRHSRLTVAPLPWLKTPVKEFINTMENVDFSECDLRYIHFDGVDLSSCKLPADENLLVINDQNRIFTSARDIIDTSWKGEERNLGLRALDNTYLSLETSRGYVSPEHLLQPIQVVNLLDLREGYGDAFGNRLFEVFKKLVSDQQAMHAES